MKLNFLFIFLLASIAGFSQSKGTISGTLSDKDAGNQPLPFANVLIKGTKNNATTDIDGKYSVSIAPGNYVIQFSFLGYETAEFPAKVIANETVIINKSLGTGGYVLQDVVVKSAVVNREKETALLLEQKNAVEIKQSIGAQEMSRKGVSDVEEGLTKMTGISKVGSRGLFVRGLEDRYNSLLINNLAVPSNNPFKKIIPLDLIPTDVVSLIESYKTFNPDLYGDFAGATFNIVTLTKPVKNITKISFGTSMATNNNFRDFYFADNVNTTKGFFGLAGNDRYLPSEFGSKPNPPVTLTGSDAVNAFDSGYNIEKTKSPLNTSFGILHAEKFNFKDDKFSYLLSLNFDNSHTYRKGVDRTLQNGSNIEFSNDFLKTAYNYKTNFSSILGLNYSTNRLNLSGSLLYLKSTENQVQDQYGIQNNFENVTNYLVRLNELTESKYLNGQIFGEYFLSDAKNQSLKGGFLYSDTNFNQPDRNSYAGTQVAEDQINSSYGGNNFLRQYLDISGNNFMSGFLEYNYKFKNDNKLVFGYNGNMSFNESSYRFIQLIKSNPNTGSNFVINPFELDSKINDDLLNNNTSFRESSNATWKAKMEENINAGYANYFHKFSDKFDMNAGIRLEKYNRQTLYKEIGSFNSDYKEINADELYFIPSINMKYTMSEMANLRFAGSSTYTKPVIMESFPIQIVNPDGTVYQGNPYLVNSKNLNFELKYEIFPTQKEMFATSLFAKKIDNPIERTFLPNSGSTITSFLNSDQAILYGLEAEMILDLGRLSSSMDDLSWGLNTTLMQTNVNVPDTVTGPNGNVVQSIETHKDRELQGASKWMVNSDLKYQFDLNKNWSNTLSLVYSVFGKRIYSVGTAGIDHIYELPVSKLDFIINSKISEHIDLKLSADNILNPKTKLEVGENSKDNYIESSRIVQDYKKGVGFSLNLSYTF